MTEAFHISPENSDEDVNLVLHSHPCSLSALGCPCVPLFLQTPPCASSPLLTPVRPWNLRLPPGNRFHWIRLDLRKEGDTAMSSSTPPVSPPQSTSHSHPPPPPSRARPPKSPPLAFEKTSNDSLYAPVLAPEHPQLPHHPQHSRDYFLPPAEMGLASPATTGERELQVIIDRQSSAIDKLYEAFQAERDCWLLEKRRLHGRIAALERLLKSGDHWR